VPLRILTDAHISPGVAHQLTAIGFDVVCTRDRGLQDWEDWDLIAWCNQEQRAICTKNRRHFEREHRRCVERGEHHYGVLIIGEWTTNEIYWALRQFLEAKPDRSLNDQVVYISKASPDFIQAHSGE
jgi:predicted nuclease of predicted toxin-antitoxin system